MKRLRSLRGLSSLAQIDNLTTEELYITSTLLADKYLIDEGENEQLFNSDLAELTGITVERFNLIERQALLALNWNLYVSDNEFHEFLSLFKSQMAKTFNENLDPLKTIDLVEFLSMCFKFLLHTIEYGVWISLLLIGASLSTLISIHFGALTRSTSIKTCNSTINCAHSAVSIGNNYENKNYNLINYLKSVIYALIESDSIYNNGDFNLSRNKLHALMFNNCSLSANAQGESNISPTQSPWFWPLLSICIVLLVGIPCILFMLIVICHSKYKLNDASDESSVASNASSSSASPTVPEQHDRRHRRTRYPRSHYVTGFRTPPPPYTTSDQPRNVFVTASPPPSYGACTNENTLNSSSTIIALPQTEPIENPTERSLNESGTSTISVPPVPIANSTVISLNDSTATTINVLPTHVIESQISRSTNSSSSSMTNPPMQTFEA
ncbi:unnamed protein product [Rotaria magnacalcarata]|uniref:Protein CNPPD1 n=3 Tax=Rotaria magnacalcarata TaxID=392030 RepID=A0A8S2Z1Q7_9BILA|nr:unnamed protein product [Rotaria magnacalcarata]